MSTKTTGTMLLLCWAAALASAQEGARPRPQTLRDPEIYTLYHSDVSRPLHEMPVLEPEEEVGEARLHRVKFIRPLRPVPQGWQDPLQQAELAATEPVPQVSTTAGLSFDGVGVGLGTFTPSGAPPDTVGAPGLTQYVQWVNTSFAVFDKATGALVFGPAAGNTLWQGFGGPCETTNTGDPIALYDKAANRWVMTQFSINQAANQFFQCVAVSTTSDATGSYRRFAYSFTGFNDYPKLGVWPDGYYISFNMFNAAGTAFTGGRVCALDRNQMLTAAGTPGAIQCFQLSTAFGGLLPADLDGSTPPPAGSPNYFVAFDGANNNGLNLWKFHVDWANSANSTFTGPTKIMTAPFSPACGGGSCIPQPSTTQRLDALADRLMYRLAYRNFGTHESLVVNHSVTTASAASGVRWYELRSPGGTPTLFQSGTFSPDAAARWMGSIAQDKQGNMLLGYSASSSTQPPSIRYTGRLVSDAFGAMQAENTLMAGIGSQTGGLSRWGDYSAMTIDPVDDCTFWFTTQYLKASGSFNWSTRIGSFKFPGCGGAATPDFSIATSPSSLSIVQGGSGGSTVTVTSVNSFTATVALSCSGLPVGVTCSFSPASVAPPSNGNATSALTVSVSAGTAVGDYSFQVTGTSGSLSHSTPLSLTVNPTGGGAQTALYDATLRAPRCAAVGTSCDSGPSLLLGRNSKGPEPNQPNTINNSCSDGNAGTFHVDESNDRLKVSTLDGTTIAPGKTVKIEATVWAWTTPSSDRLDLYYAADAASRNWTFIATLSPTVVGSQVLSATYTLPAGASQAVRARFRYNGSAAPCNTASQPAQSYDDHDDLVFAVGPPPPDYSVSATPASLTIAQGANGTSTVAVSSQNGFASPVVLSCTGLQPGVTCGFSPDTVTPPAGGSANSTLTVSVSASAAAGTSPFSVVGASYVYTRSASLSLTVTPRGGGPQTATYDATLKAPKCTAVGSSCDSGASLLLGANSKGPEPNHPNTINSSCADGAAGTFHLDESNDRIKVSTLDGTSFAPGKTVRIDATVWAWTTPSADRLDLYYAANAQSPVWIFVGTLTPTAVGAQTLSATYTLPPGALQAVRAQFRYQGSASPCTSGGYNDRDDLIFAVNTPAEGWTATSTTGAPSARQSHKAVWTGTKMIVWGGSDGLNTGGIYHPATDKWTATSTAGAPSSRVSHALVWTGTKMIVWGGFDGDVTNTGGIYDPATDTWTAMSTVGAPSSRASHAVVWTGTKMIVWGGYDGARINTGGIYDPATDTWTATSTVGAPSSRAVPKAVWTGSKMIIWGGYVGSIAFANTGGIYDPATDTWTATSTVGAPPDRNLSTDVWTGSKMIIWAGNGEADLLNTGAVYDPVTDTWTATSTVGAPSARFHHSAVWTGLKMIAWGGFGSPFQVLDTGGIYDPATNAWTPTSTVGAPLAREGHTAVWTGSQMIVWGGYDDGDNDYATGGIYSPPGN